VFSKRDAFRTAFHGFDVTTVAAMTGRDVSGAPLRRADERKRRTPRKHEARCDGPAWTRTRDLPIMSALATESYGSEPGGASQTDSKPMISASVS
jgi:hypothetical protein